MRSMFGYFTPTKPDGTTFTKTERCLQALQFVAMCWFLLGTLPTMFESNISTDTRHRLWFMQTICTFMSAAIYSVLLPLRRILRDSDK